MSHQPQQIVDPDMLVRLHKVVAPPRNIVIAAGDSVLESIWCDKPKAAQANTEITEADPYGTPPWYDIPRGFGGYGACESCFEYRLLLRGYCLDCDAFARQPW